tara:strand:+ start:384 stop:635 length:252 start_codon:yes stop_codon:yes gene_type:complete
MIFIINQLIASANRAQILDHIAYHPRPLVVRDTDDIEPCQGETDIIARAVKRSMLLFLKSIATRRREERGGQRTRARSFARRL